MLRYRQRLRDRVLFAPEPVHNAWQDFLANKRDRNYHLRDILILLA